MISRFELRGEAGVPLCHLRFATEDRRGVLSREVLASLETRLAELAADEVVRLVVLEGAREDLFAAGADLEDIVKLTPQEALDFADAGRRAIGAWGALLPTTVAVVQGACFGGALDLVLASDLIVAYPSARFAHPGVRRGIVTGWGGTVRAGLRLSRPALHRLFVEAEPIGAERAHANGLVDFVVRDPASLEDLLNRWAGPEGDSLRLLKRVSRDVAGLPPAQALRVEERLQELLRASSST